MSGQRLMGVEVGAGLTDLSRARPPSIDRVLGHQPEGSEGPGNHGQLGSRNTGQVRPDQCRDTHRISTLPYLHNTGLGLSSLPPPSSPEAEEPLGGELGRLEGLHQVSTCLAVAVLCLTPPGVLNDLTMFCVCLISVSFSILTFSQDPLFIAWMI